MKQEREIKDNKHYQANRLAFYIQLKTMIVDNLQKYPHWNSERMGAIYNLANYGEHEELKNYQSKLCAIWIKVSNVKGIALWRA